MVGREGDLERLRGLLEAVADGVPRTAVIGGEAGIGKTRLLAEFTASVPPEVLVLRGQSVDLGTVAAPYAPVKDVLRSLIAEVGAEAVMNAAGPGRPALTALLPELAQGDTDAGSSAQLHEAVAVVLERFSHDRSVVAVVEDLHWIDAASLTLLRFLIRAVRRGRLLLVLTYRSDDVTRGHPVRGFLTELDRGRAVDRWELARLTKAQVRRQVKAILGGVPDPDLLARTAARSEGVPFFVEELLGLDTCPTDDGLPDTLRDLLLARYERLEPGTQAVLRLLAAGGVRVPHELIAAVHSGAAEDLDAAIREAVFASVLVAGDDDYAFRHALVREAIHAELLPGERGRFHAAYAEALERTAGSRRVAAEISYHWMAAHVPEKAFPATLAAREEARAAFAYATAGQMGERALELWDQVAEPERVAGMNRLELLGRTSSHLRNAGENERSLALIDLALADGSPDRPLQYARALRDKAYYLGNAGRTGTVPLLEQAVALVPPGSPGELRATMLTALAGRLMIEGRAQEAIAMATDASTEAAAAGSDRYSSVAHNIAGVSMVHNGDVEGGLAELERARVLGDGDRVAGLRYRVNISDVHYLLGRYRSAVQLAESGLARARELGVERISGVILASNAVDPYYALGEWDRADALIERGLSLDPPFAFRVYLQRARMWGMLWRGDVSGAAVMFRSLAPSIASLVEAEMQTRLGIARLAAEIAIAEGDDERAWEEASVVFRAEHRSLPGYDLPLLAVAARALAGIRRSNPEAASSIDIDAAASDVRGASADLAGWPTAPVWTAFVEAELGGSAGTGLDPVLWRRARTAAAGGPVHLGPYASLRLAEAQIAAGDRVGAHESLQAAVADADSIGIGLVGDQARAVARRARVNAEPPSQPVSDPAPDAAAEPLTPREQQVLELVARGLSNREIGTELFISGKTASVHVSAILRKLGASTRTEAVFLAGAATR
ncbi:LuxR family transcriptional regulator [Leifsonia flava]|uniref:LuxR family transcriptional regulator n=2 Tax=Orlajensenia leifsoniae TaxID=2561933 RepID=A0A4Y9R7U7_9MICO|nr:LuxR family transcriptional regulator [Leifsonia flava]